MEALYLVCGARRPQLKRDPLGVTEVLLRSILVVSVSLVLASLTTVGASQALPPIATKGLDLLVRGRTDSAAQLWTSAWTGPGDVGKRQQVLDGFRQMSQIAGSVLGYDLIRAVDLGPHLRRAYFLLQCERQPVYLLLVLYQAKATWIVSTLNFNTDADRVLPPALFGPEHPGRP